MLVEIKSGGNREGFQLRYLILKLNWGYCVSIYVLFMNGRVLI